ncbi:MAG: 6-bladed beta-propeller [Bacteroidia bacterium]|nr:6-bladed beta-propeller [Bacteroidia bacterium]
MKIRLLLITLSWISLQLNSQVIPPKEIYVPGIIDHKIELNLSGVFPYFSYTLLETTKGSYVGKIEMLFMDQNLILLYDGQSKKLLRFSKDGRFVGEFMTRGNGPGEFIEISSIDGNGEGAVLILKNGDCIDIMDYEGHLVKTFRLSVTPAIARWVNPNVIALFYPYPRYYQNGGYEIDFIDRSGKVISRELKHSMKDTGSGVGTYTICQHNQGSLYYWNPQNDTVFTISRSAGVYPRYIFTHDQRHSDAMKTRTARYSPSLDGVYIVASYHEWGDYIFLSGYNNKISYLGLINKKRNISGDINYDMKKCTWDGLLNDVDGGMPFWPERNQPDGSMTKSIDAIKLLEICERNKLFGLKFDPAKKIGFQKEVFEKVTESSNPIIMRIDKEHD